MISGRSRGGDARTLYLPSLGFIKGYLRRFWHTHGFINLKEFTHTQNLALGHTSTFRMKSMESFINETPGIIAVFIMLTIIITRRWVELCK